MSLRRASVDWPYSLEWDQTSTLAADVLVLGGGIAGCWAAIGAAKRGASVVLVEKGATVASGAGGSGCDQAVAQCLRVNQYTGREPALTTHGYFNGSIN